jgi:hypothetical protein
MAAGDVGDDDVQPRAIGQQGVDERAADIHAPAGRAQHPLDEVVHLALGEHHRGQLGTAAARAEHAAGLVPPQLLDLRVVEEPLQRAVAGHRVMQLSRPRLDLLGGDVVALGGQPVEHVEDGRADGGRVGERVGTAVAHQRADAVEGGLGQGQVDRGHGEPRMRAGGVPASMGQPEGGGEKRSPPG